MLFDDTYLTISKPAEGIFRDKGSKFIGVAYPVQSLSAVKELIEDLRTKHPKARHFCWAVRLSPDRSLFKINDDGEPSGTAGRPILNTLLSADLTNVLVIVVRYFGGTLLGVPGLINAYKTATTEAIAASEIISKTINDLYQLSFPYTQMNDVMRIIKEEQLQPTDQHFDQSCMMNLEIRKSRLIAILGRFEKLDGVKAEYLSTI
ncbi:IMPACT family protein [Pedobacter duraquae]|uniref:Putative YigZ family protein n=1 Tax=Pedobacter duraquae TaxID=425511 RepID=A0A4R6IF02_9SPHI|nr:YigZ family protein [Pedobacter duraquae]TDO20632.1 putative YigZ family protein [Pedobacter duraquae]